ncbi:hypothetical protein BDV95DRAFT_644940 [Massariosphaeria phaeospora]|uniref:Uncharacterized protein n=1 Tax=Massariosphaeria phaeospora TaxID=100035 RepID=A0A7C8IQ82_9PLEO|nr:hypothetical protein BDV95DRAFT_644940 [Massariosphaeria phaeospora]
MAESLAIVGLASNIISFIEFGLKLVSGAKTLRESPHRTLPEISELETILHDVRTFNNEVLRQKSSGQQLSQDEQGILEMVKECNHLARQIQNLTKDLKVRPEARWKMWENGRTVCKVLMNREEMKDMQRRLESLSQRIKDNVRQSLDEERNSAIMGKLRSIERSHRENEINYVFVVDAIRNDIMDLTSQSQDAGEMRGGTEAAHLTNLKIKLDTLFKQHGICKRQLDIIESLYFPDLRRRYSQIPEVELFTNAWLLDPTKTTFMEWLESRDNTYWITGKAGSGKSTLMKFAAEHPDTLQALKRWAEPAELYTAGYFFWNQGFEMQKSQLGLFQSLLYQILKCVPSLIPHVCPARQTHEVWEISELMAIFKRIAEQEVLEAKFCFFIDGLDEYDGKEEEVVRLITFLSASPHVKICASSRQRSIFEEFFNNKSRRLTVHDFTKDDMNKYVRQRLCENPRFQHLLALDPAYEEIVRLISGQAKGVWLWVFLVTKDLVGAINRHEDLPTFRRIVDQLPQDLEEYFTRIIQRIEKQYQQEMAQIFLISIHARTPKPLFYYSLLERERADPDYALKAPVRPMSVDEISENIIIWKSRLHNRCGDLLVVEDVTTTLFGPKVDFLHRTVRDFLRECCYRQLRETLTADFISEWSLCKMVLYSLKAVPAPDLDRHVAGSLTLELIRYASIVEKGSELLETLLADLLDELDRVNNFHLHSVDSVLYRSRAKVFDPQLTNLMMRAVQYQLIKYVRTRLLRDPLLVESSGQPLLTHALSSMWITNGDTSAQEQKERPNICVRMVNLLLDHGSNPNEKLHDENGHQSVWAAFLYRTMR